MFEIHRRIFSYPRIVISNSKLIKNLFEENHQEIFVLIDLFSIHFRRIEHEDIIDLDEFRRGCRKPLYEAPDLKFHQIH